MYKRYSLFWFLMLISSFALFVNSAIAIDLDEATRTVTVDASGKTTVLTPEQVKRGKRLFNATCGACHLGGITKTNPNVGLDPEALSLATPRRDNIESLVDYLKIDRSVNMNPIFQVMFVLHNEGENITNFNGVHAKYLKVLSFDKDSYNNKTHDEACCRTYFCN